MNKIFILVMAGCLAAVHTKAQGSVTAKRLVLKATYHNDGATTEWDTVTYTWSGTRGSAQYFRLLGPGRTSPLIGRDEIKVDATEYDHYEHWFSPSSATEAHVKTLKTYNSEGNALTECQLYWDAVAAKWDTSLLISNTYSGLAIASAIREEKGGLRTRSNWTYTGDSAIIHTELWDESSAVWLPYQRFIDRYSREAKWFSLLSYWRAGTWVDSSRYVDEFDLNRIIRVFSVWKSGVRKDTARTIRHFWTGLPALWAVIGQVFNPVSAAWEQRYYTYYSGPKADRVDSVRFVTGHGALFTEKGDFTYDAAGNVVGITYSKLDAFGVWVNASRILFQYDADHYLLSEERNTWTGTAWTLAEVPDSKAFYYYEDYEPLGVGTTGLVLRSASLYPNPVTTPNVYLSYFSSQAIATEVVLTDVLGRVCYRKQEGGSIGDHLLQLPVGELPSGLYLVSIRSGAQVLQTLKLQKQ